MDISAIITSELSIKKYQTDAAIKLIDEGNTIPFIARYRKEVTGSLNDEQLRLLDTRLKYLRNLEERKEAILASIDEQGKLTDDLKSRIDAAQTLVVLEDLYRPYKQKRKTRASIAKEKGLEGLANTIRLQMINISVMEEAKKYINPEKEVNTIEDAINGAKDIIAENIADDSDYRIFIRNITIKEGMVKSVSKSEESTVYDMYYDFSESVSKIAGHRVLALNRGEKEKILKVDIEAPVEQIFNYLKKQVVVKNNPNTNSILEETIDDAYKRLIAPSVEREVRNMLTEKEEKSAIDVFGKNLVQLLMQPPISGKVVLGWDPAFRTGCKLSVVDETGKVLDTKVIYPTAPQNKVVEAKTELRKLIEKYNVELISVGNGTASRESEAIIADFIKEIPQKVQYIITNEAGASVYSASKLATEEFPDLDVGQRSATSIARRLQDPLAELVKIDPKSIGVGQYQHDCDQKLLEETLNGVVEDCVNKVGVDLNTASASLLSYVAGISKPIAKNIVDYRESNGKYRDRKQLLKVPKLGPKAYEQCAGFLRIKGGDNPLDATAVHPESYEATAKILKFLSLDTTSIESEAGRLLINEAIKKIKDKKVLAADVGIGEITLNDILNELVKPGRDPREDMPKPVLRSDVLDMKDLKTGMILKGTVRNVIDFGVFVDIGVHQDGLVHISQICDRYIKHPLEVVSVGDVVEVSVLEVIPEKNRIALSMKQAK